MADKVEGDRGALETKVIEVVAPVVAEKDEFETAFDEANVLGDRADLSAADDPAKIAEEPPVVVPSVVTPPVVETPPIETSSVVQQPGESDEKFEQRYKTLQGIHKHDKEAWESERATLITQLEEAKKPLPKAEPTPAEKAAAEAFVDSLTPEQQEQLTQYEQDFDVVSKMEGIKRGVELAKLRKEMQVWKEEVATQLATQSASLDTRIAPVVKLAEENDRDAHFNMIRDGYDLEDGTHVPGHSDFEKFRDDGSLLNWIEAKPRYLQPALKQVYSQGAATDVVDLIADFKRESNITSPLPSDNVIQMDPKKAARKQALTTVTTRRGAVNASVAAVSDDFEGAFDEALNK